MRRLLAIAGLAVFFAGGCRSSQASIEIGFGDAGTCAQANDLGCVNFLQFSVDDGTAFTTHCVKVTQKLEDLCDVAKLASGEELFTLDPDREVVIEVKGLRVFPANSCEVEVACQRRQLFFGTTGPSKIKIGDFAGRSIPLVVNLEVPCGEEGIFFDRPTGVSCEKFCGAALLLCEISDGCICGPR